MNRKLRYYLKTVSISFFIVGVMLFFFSSDLHAQYYAVQTSNFQIFYYNKAHSYVIPHLTRCLENSLGFHRHLFHYTPSEKIVVLLEDFDDYGYAGAISIPYNYVQLGIEPYKYVFETAPTNERFNWVTNHELAHIVASDKSSKRDRFFRSLFFGKISPTEEHPISMFYSFLASPRMYSPRWYHEGIAVFLETWMSGGIGRVLGGYDEMVFRAMVRDSSYIYDVVGLESEGTTIDFQVGANSYLYGTRFLSYLALQYGPEKILDWFSRTNDSKSYFASQFKNVYGVSLDDEWSRWIEWEHQWQEASLDSIRSYPTTRYRKISQPALGSVSRAYYDSVNRKIYSAVNYPGQLAHIASIDVDNGKIEKICDVPGPALYHVSSLAYDQSGDALFYTSNNRRHWRTLNVVDIKTRKSKILLKDARIGDLAVSPLDRSLWGVQHHNGISKLVRLPPPYKEWYEILSLDYGKDLFDIDISPDGLYVTASLIEISGRQTLIRMEIEKLLLGDSSYEVLIEFENNTSPENFVYAPDGKFLFGTSYYTGVSNVFRYDFETKKRDALTNSETGLFRPVPVSDDSLVVFEYTGKGFVPVMIANESLEDVSAIKYLGQEIVENHPVVKTWMIGSPLQIDVDSVTISSGEYHGFRNIKLASAYPVVEGFKDFAAFGMRFNLSDPLQIYGISLTASYTPNTNLPENQRRHFAVKYNHWPWKFRATYNKADFYDLFGPTKTSRKEYSVRLQYNNFLLYDKPKTLEYTVSAARYGRLERLPDFQNIAASFDKVFTVKGDLHYQYLVKSLGAVEHEQGVTWQLNSFNNYVNSKLFPRLFANVDYGFLLPIDHSSIWLRSSFGYSFGDRDEPFANFFFGGFGNNAVDYQEENRYREYYSFPGVELNEIGGKNYGKMLLEWTLPPVRFRRLGFPSLYFTWSRLALFSTGIVSNFDSDQQRRSLLNTGAQVNLRLVLFSRLDATFSLGYAVSYEKNHRRSDEFMVSLRIF
ncbi:MAG: hypothetical protein ACE5H0_06065 [Bacteroidota bacterium]